MWFIVPGYIIIVTVVAVTELNMFRYSHPSPTIAAWTIIYFAFDLAICMMANLGVTNNLKVYILVLIQFIVKHLKTIDYVMNAGAFQVTMTVERGSPMIFGTC